MASTSGVLNSNPSGHKVPGEFTCSSLTDCGGGLANTRIVILLEVYIELVTEKFFLLSLKRLNQIFLIPLHARQVSSSNFAGGGMLH